MPYIPSDDAREFFNERPGLHAAILGVMSLGSLITCIFAFLRDGSEFQKWGTLVLVLVLLPQCLYRLWQVFNGKR